MAKKHKKQGKENKETTKYKNSKKYNSEGIRKKNF